MRIRVATLRDCNALTLVHRSDITKWYRHVGNQKIEDAYENLSLLDRYLIGGPWMSLETCAIYLNYLLTSGQYPLVAEVNGKVIGEIDVFIGEEPSPIKKNACISVLEVARDYRGKGVGKALVSEAIKLAKEHGCNVIATVPAGNAINFYKKCGLDEILFELKHIEVDLERLSRASHVKVEVAELNSFDVLRRKHMVYGRYDSSFAEWLKRRWRFSILPSSLIWEEGFIPSYKAAYRIERHPLKKDICKLLAWTENPLQALQLLEVCANRAKELGYRKLETTISMETANLIESIQFSTLDSDVILGKNLISSL